jgi:glutamate synthase (NADPH/NADH) small chain
VTGFLEWSRHSPARRPVALRLRDWREVYLDQDPALTREQAGRCMDCGIPFCHNGCPLGNLIPEWNDLVYRDRFDEALDRLHATNNFPEFTGRLCPSPCESSCVLAIADEAVTIERIEYEIVERGFSSGRVRPEPPALERTTSIAIVGSGPAGLAAAQQLRRAGHQVTVFERQEQIGGLLRFGIPEFKMEKSVIDRRLEQMVAEGVRFEVGAEIGQSGAITLEELRGRHDAVLLAVGSTRPRELDLPGRDLRGVVPAMEYLKPANLASLGASMPAELDAAGRDVVILGGGDTGADCLGTVLRQGARSVRQLEIMERPPDSRPDSQPWPTMPLLFKVTSAHEEGGERIYAAETTAFAGDDAGRVSSLIVRDAASGETHETPAQLVLIAAGFVGPEVDDLGAGAVPVGPRGTIEVDDQWRVRDGLPGSLFACGDAVRGQSLIVWALAEGRAAASAIDGQLLGASSALPAPVSPHFTAWG